MKSILIRDKRRRTQEAESFLSRLTLKYLLRKSVIQKSPKIYYNIRKKLERMPRNSSVTRIKNRCIFTGHGRGIHKKFKLSRISIRSLGLTGQLAGLRKSSW